MAFDVAFFGGDVAAAHGKSASAISEEKMSKTVGGSHSAANPISRPAVLMRHRDDLQPLLRYPVHQRERKPAQQLAARPVNVGRPCIRKPRYRFNCLIEFKQKLRGCSRVAFAIPGKSFA